jgi:hypothetical protein
MEDNWRGHLNEQPNMVPYGAMFQYNATNDDDSGTTSQSGAVAQRQYAGSREVYCRRTRRNLPDRSVQERS